MTEMLERCARQIEPLAWAALGMADTQAHARRREASLWKAREVLEAMREPTDSMVEAVERVGIRVEGNRYNSPGSDWRAMIDAALSDT